MLWHIKGIKRYYLLSYGSLSVNANSNTYKDLLI